MGLSSLLKPVSDSVNKVLDKVLPDQISELDREKLKIEMSSALMDDLYKHQDLLVTLQTHKTGSKILDAYRAFVRPTIALGFLALYAFHKYQASFLFDEFDKSMLSGIIMFYFGLRTFEKFKKKDQN